MTKFINLESYIECCEYAYLFAEDPSKLIPHVDKLPIAYRDFCNRNLSHSFLSIPTVATNQPTSLTPRTHQLSQQCRNIGLQLAGNSLEKIFIIREANSIVSGNIGPRYLYANVYRYWNYAQQLQQFTSSQKPLIIYDLDSFTPAQITPITFENRSNAPYPIPIIDTRSLKEDNTLKLSQSYEEIYDTICLEIAHHIGQDLKLNSQDVLEVSKYIKKINLFQNIDFTGISNIPLILDINDRYYLYDLSQEILARIIYPNLPIAELKQIIKNNPYCNFVLLSSFNNLSSIKNILQQSFQDNLFITDKAVHNFHKIWQQKLENQFPLFGQHLDRISFLVTRANEKIEEEISLPQKTCYEGQQEEILYGEYLKEGKLEQNFPLKKSNVTLPFRINEKPFLENDIEQAYQIENQYFEETPELNIKIRFRIKPGLIPKLEVIDDRDRILKSSLINNEYKEVECTDDLGFIPFNQILDNRQQKSQKLIDTFNDSSSQFSIMLKNGLEGFTNILNKYNDGNQFQDLNTLSKLSKQILDLINEYGKIDEKDRGKRGIEFYTFDDSVIVSNQYVHDLIGSLFHIYQKIDNRLQDFLLSAKRQGISTNTQMSREYGYLYRNVIQILGKSFLFTRNIDLDFLYDLRQINYGAASSLVRTQNEHIYSIHLQNISRLACIPSRQKKYFELFNCVSPISPYDRVKFYQSSDYIWGYARLLMWYVDFRDKATFDCCQDHFSKILNQCLSLNYGTNSQHKKDKPYMTDALISLIYLLSFRQYNPHFVNDNSSEYDQAINLCRKLHSSEIKSKRANLEVPLNQFFEQLLNGSATQEQVRNMIEID